MLALRGLTHISLILFLLFISLCGFSKPVFSSSSFWPTAAEWRQSFNEALLSPATWIPFTGAVLVSITNTDKRISNWASSNTPVFGSQQNADKASDHLNHALGAVSVVSLLVMPRRDEDKSWFVEKGEYFLVMSASVGAASAVTGGIKDIVHRVRPSGHDNHSFPSGHSTTAFGLAAVSSKNINQLCMPPPPHIFVKTSIYLMATGVAWARVEAKKHYPTDVLMGAAIGNFVTSFIYGAFINKPPNERVNVFFEPLNEGGMMLHFDKTF